MIKIFLASSNEYSQHLAATMASVLANAKNDEYKFYILDGGISEENKNRILKLKSIKDCKIEFVSIDLNMFKDCPSSRHTANTYSRMKIPELFPDIEKAIYLDCDVIVRSDIAEFWSYNLDGYCQGVIRDSLSVSRAEKLDKYFKSFGIEVDNYFNNGITLMNLEELRKFKIFEKAVKWFKRNRKRIRFGDQDVYNILLAGKVKYLPLEWNTSPSLYKKLEAQYFNPNNIEPKIIHYTTTQKPWLYMSSIWMKDEYYKYLKLTEWKDYEALYIPKKSFLKRFLSKIVSI